MDILTSKTILDYPIYACDFDPADAGRLVVGGGAGARKSDGNKITLLNASTPTDPDLTVTTDLRLPREEDNITSLAAGPRRGRATLAFAGINSSVDDLKKGKNEHFRVFGVDGSSAKNPKISELARASFFSSEASEKGSAAKATPDVETYQRIVRLSAPFSDGNGSTLPQIGACATDMSKNPQIVIFDVTSAAPAAAAPSASSNPVTPRIRGRLELTKDIQDLDVIQTDVDKFQLAYCTPRELYIFDISTKSSGSNSTAASKEPLLVYDMPLDERGGATERPAFHSIRYLTPNFILASCNLPRRTGVFLTVLRLPDKKAIDEAAAKENAPANDEQAVAAGEPAAAAAAADPKKRRQLARISTNAKLPMSVTYATSLAARNLSPPTAPGARQDDTQFVVAVGDANNAISLYTAELQTIGKVEIVAKLYPFRTLKQVHSIHITSLQLSHFHAPTTSSSSAPTQYLRLASVSVGNTVVVHHIPLKKLPASSGAAAGSALAPSSSSSSSSSSGESSLLSSSPLGKGKTHRRPALPPASVRPPPRYVVAIKSRAPSGMSLYVFIVSVVALMVLLSQAWIEVRGLGPTYLGARDVAPARWLAPEWKPPVAAAAVTAETTPVGGGGGGGGEPVVPVPPEASVPESSHKVDEL